MKYTTNDLKIYAGSQIVESVLPKEAKSQLLKFIQHEANDAQIKALIMDGKITKTDPITESVIEDRFKNYLTDDMSKAIIKNKK